MTIVRSNWIGFKATKDGVRICRRSLIEWSKKEFKSKIQEINKAKQRLRRLGN